MPFFQMDDKTDSEARVLRAGTAAFGLYARCGVWASRNTTDGFVSAEIAAQYGTREWIERLVATGLWVPVDDGFVMPDFLSTHKNRSAEKIQADRDAKAARQARWLEAHRNGSRAHKPNARRVTNPSRDASQDTSLDASKDVAPPLPSPKGEGVGAAPLRGAPPPPTQQPAQAPSTSRPVCATHQLPVPCRGCFAEAKAAAAAAAPPPRQPTADARPRADPQHLAPAGPDPAYDHAQHILRQLSLEDRDALLTEARADLDAEGQPSPSLREVTLRAAQLATTDQFEGPTQQKAPHDDTGH